MRRLATLVARFEMKEVANKGGLTFGGLNLSMPFATEIG
jgi:hypothetical protein